MKIEIRGVIESFDGGHKNVDVVVTEDPPHRYKKHRVGVDIEATRGRINTLLVEKYAPVPVEITWAEHIDVKNLG